MKTCYFFSFNCSIFFFSSKLLVKNKFCDFKLTLNMDLIFVWRMLNWKKLYSPA